MPTNRPRYFLIDLLLVIVFCGLVFATIPWAWQIVVQVQTHTVPDESHRRTFIALDIGFVAWFITWWIVRARRKATACAECGRRFIQPKKSNGPTTCPRCRQRALSPIGLKKERTKGLLSILVFLAFLTFFIGYLLSDFAGARFGRSYWVALPLLATGATLGLPVALVLALFLFLLARNRFFSVPKFALAHARKVAGEEGEESELGPLTVWYSGTNNPAKLLEDQMEAARGRVAAMIGDVVEVRGPLHVLCFERRDAFVAYHRQRFTDLWNLDGIYTPAPVRSLSLTTEVVAHRLSDAESTARSLFSLAMLEEYKGYLLAPWLQQGINYAVASGTEGLDRLHRKMIVSMARSTTLGAELFRMKAGTMFKWLRGWQAHENHLRLAQFNYQSWSLIEYLCGEEAPEDLKGRFAAYFTALRKGEPDEPVFRDHLGCGYDGLLEGWGDWVSRRDPATHAPPSPQLRDALRDRVIPKVVDPTVRVMDRILAIRAMGGVGHVLGANALIGLLRAGGEIPKEEVVWSLEAISGMAWGDDLDRWSEWWDGLPQSLKEG